ncbi:MAG TPA: polysaccharide biosynthesis/export family protein [Bacteroidia bacterium]|nr:polysaccharide biosynthesis/export family protein [Bacteroidia bacterium]
MKKTVFRFAGFIVVVAFLIFSDSCNVLNPNIMLHAGRKYKYDTLANDSTVAKEFTLGPNDIIEFRLFANDGFKMIDIISSGNTGASNNTLMRTGFEYTLDDSGTVRLPVVGDQNLTGLTVRQAEDSLQKKYSEYYVDPFVIIKIINKRVIIYNGEPGQAKVVGLSNNNTTIIEALALAGGISGDGKAYNIKLIRHTTDPKKPIKVYKINLSKIDGIKDGSTIVQSGDIIYVEPRKQIAGKALREVTPVLSLTTSLLTFYYLITKLL